MQRPEAYRTDPAFLNGLPINADGIEITAGAYCRTYEVSPFRRVEEKLNKCLQEYCGVTLPGTSGASSSEQFQLLWCRFGAFFLVCPPEVEAAHLGELAKFSAINEVSDGWIRLIASGERVEMFLQTGVSIDLSQVPEETTFISDFNGMRIHFYKTTSAYHIRTERSLGSSVVSELQQAVRHFQAVEKFKQTGR